MPTGKITKKSKKSNDKKRSRPSRRQVDEDLGKLKSLDHTIQEHQKAQFYGLTEAQLDFQESPSNKQKSHNRSLRALENLTKVNSESAHQQKAKHTRDLRALDSVLETLSKIEFTPSDTEHKQASRPRADDAEIDV